MWDSLHQTPEQIELETLMPDVSDSLFMGASLSSIELLEPRLLLASNVLASIDSGGNLAIEGDADSAEFTVH